MERKEKEVERESRARLIRTGGGKTEWRRYLERAEAIGDLSEAFIGHCRL